LPCMATLACQHQLPEFGRGRFVHVNSPGHARVQRSVVGLVVVMFAIYFIDSLGFLRLLNAPVYMNTAWQSPDPSIRLFIGGVHVAAALIAGILYANLDVRALFLWIFGIFALVHLMYGFHNRLVPGMTAPLTMPMLYATAVSMYTVVNFAIWADISTPSTVALRTAVGVALSGWTATFLSTSLAIRWRLTGMPLLEHLNIVDALAMICFAAMLLLVYLHPKPGRRHGTSRELP
ncbi:MAG: hypothetical protein ACK2U9_12535, partial [Anaerolineae bacterium]